VSHFCINPFDFRCLGHPVAHHYGTQFLKLLAGNYGQLANESLKTTNHKAACYESILTKWSYSYTHS